MPYLSSGLTCAKIQNHTNCPLKQNPELPQLHSALKCFCEVFQADIWQTFLIFPQRFQFTRIRVCIFQTNSNTFIFYNYQFAFHHIGFVQNAVQLLLHWQSCCLEGLMNAHPSPFSVISVIVQQINIFMFLQTCENYSEFCCFVQNISNS